MGIKYYIRLLAIPLFLLVLFLSLLIVAEIIGLPPEEEIAQTIEVWFDNYGLPAIFVSSIIEGALVVGSYFPGVFVIFLGVALSSSVPQAAVVVAVATLGLFIAHIFNYVLGRYGWYRLLVKFGFKGAVKRSQEKLLKRGPVAIFSSYWLPSVAALTDTAAGIIRMPFKKFVFFSLVSVIVWDAIVGTLVYSFKESALSIVTPGASGGVILVIIGVWIVAALMGDYFQRKKNNTSPKKSSS